MKSEWVSTGTEAIQKVRDNFERSLLYDYILIDWKMPDISGIETTRQVRSIVGPDVTIIIITAYDWEAIEVEARAAGANMLISKPLFKSSLVSAFEKTKGIAPEGEKAEVNFDFTGRHVRDDDFTIEASRERRHSGETLGHIDRLRRCHRGGRARDAFRQDAVIRAKNDDPPLLNLIAQFPRYA